MPLVLAFIEVTDANGVTRQIHNVRHIVGGDTRLQQVAGIGDPEDSTAVAKVTNTTPIPSSYALVVRDAPPNFDSGLVPVPNVLTSIQGADLKVRRLFLVNLTDEAQKVNVTDGVAVEFLKDYDLPAHGFLNLDLGGMLFDGGLKWSAAVAGTVNGQVVGDI